MERRIQLVFSSSAPNYMKSHAERVRLSIFTSLDRILLDVYADM